MGIRSLQCDFNLCTTMACCQWQQNHHPSCQDMAKAAQSYWQCISLTFSQICLAHPSVVKVTPGQTCNGCDLVREMQDSGNDSVDS